MSVEIHIGAPSRASASEQAAFAVRAEEFGFHGVGVADHAGQDVFGALSHILAGTTRITVYPAAVNPVTRTPLALAELANSLAIAAPGRTKLAIATGDTSVVEAGLRPAKLAQLREAIVGVRSLLRGDAVSFDGGPLCALAAPASLPPPVVCAASGPKTLRMAGEAADEALVTAGLDTRIVHAIASLAPVPLTHYAMVSIDDDRSAAVERTRSWLFHWLRQGIYSIALRELGIDLPPLAAPEDIPAPLLHELARRLFIAGTPRDVEAQGERLAASGVERLFGMLQGGLRRHDEQMHMIAKHLLPALAA